MHFIKHTLFPFLMLLVSQQPSPPPGSDFLITEDSIELITEDGNNLITE